MAKREGGGASAWLASAVFKTSAGFVSFLFTLVLFQVGGGGMQEEGPRNIDQPKKRTGFFFFFFFGSTLFLH